MTRVMTGLILLGIFIFSASFYQQFYIPKLIVLYGMAVVCLLFLGSRRKLRLPSNQTLIFMLCFLLAGAALGMPSSAPLGAFMQWTYYQAACLLYVAFLQFEQADLEKILGVIFVAAITQLVLLIPQHFGWHGILPEALVGDKGRVFGTLGNQEFLATLLGVAFFIGLHLRVQTEARHKRVLLLVACAALLLGLLLAESKGTLLFIGLYYLWQRIPSYRLLPGLALAALVLAIILFPASIKGRALLWLVAFAMYAQHFATGVGFLQFENHYLDVVRELFNTHPTLAQMFGSYTAMAMDAHNIYLQFAAELGSAGLLLAIVFTGYVLRRAKENRDHLGAALLLLLFKCLYTVVLTSITSVILLVLLLARTSPGRCVELGGTKRGAALVATPLIALLFVAAAALSASDYFYQQGMRALFMGRNELALEQLNTALAIDKENADASLALAHASYLLRDYEPMHRHIQNALHYRKNKDSYKVAANMYYYAKRYDDAFALYQYLHATFPQHLTSLTKLACIYMLRGDYENAHAMAQQALHTVPRKEAESDEKNLAIARQIVKDSAPYIIPSTNPNLRP